MEITNYAVAESRDREELESKIVGFINNGWEPYGSLEVNMFRNDPKEIDEIYFIIYCQAMVYKKNMDMD